MDEAEGSRFWCHMCNQTVRPIRESEAIKCPVCQSGFVEELENNASVIAATPGRNNERNDNPFDFGGSESDRALSLWAPILLGMMNNPRRVNRLRRLEYEDDDNNNNNNDDDNNVEYNHHRHNHRRHNNRHLDLETDLDRELEAIFRMRRRSSANILQLIHGLRSGMISGERDRERRDRGESVLLINPFNQTSILHQSSSNTLNTTTGSLGDYFIGPGLDLLLQHLSENDPNRHGTPPAQKDVVQALPNVKISETLQCSVCLDEIEIGGEAKEMPCKHKFHGDCIMPWLELHSSCPVCRHQLPSDEPKLEPERSTNNNTNNSSNSEGRDENENGRRFSLPWPFNSLFSSSSSSNTNTSSTDLSSPPSSSRTHED